MANVTVKPGKLIKRGQSVPFGPSNRRAKLTLQSDGNLVLYSGTFPLWSAGPNPAITKAAMQTDGNFVLYSAANAPLWATNTYGNPGARMVLQDDGNMVLYVGPRPLWSTNSSGWTRRTKTSPFENLNPAKLISAAADVVSAVAPFAKMVVGAIPLAGSIVSVAESLAKGRPLTDAFLDAAVSAAPGGAAVQMAAKTTLALVKGKRIDDALADTVLSQFPPALQKGAQFALAVAKGRNLQDAAIEQVKSFGADQIKALGVPLPSGVQVPVEMKNGAQIAFGVLNSKTLTPAAALAVRAKLAPNAKQGFDRIMSMRALKHARAGSPHAPKPLPSFKGAMFITPDGMQRIGDAWMV